MSSLQTKGGNDVTYSGIAMQVTSYGTLMASTLILRLKISIGLTTLDKTIFMLTITILLGVKSSPLLYGTFEKIGILIITIIPLTNYNSPQ